MKLKKLFMIIVLILFLLIIAIYIININTTSAKNIDNSIKENNTINSSTTTSNNIANITNTSASSSEEFTIDTNNMIEITDNYFIESTNDIYLNLQDYIGKTIKIEGLIYSYEDTNGNIYYAVVRNTPGCCGSDGLSGLDIKYSQPYPNEDTWVEVIGTIGTYSVYGSETPVIEVSSMTIKEKGKTFVTN